MKETFPLKTDSQVELERAVKHYAKAALSANTRRGYASDWSDFEYWCKRTKRKSLPASPETVALYLSKMASHLKTSSLRRRITSIRKAHELAKYSSPTKEERVKTVVRGILRTHGEAQSHAAPTLLSHIQKMIASLPDSTKGIRDKALLLLGFATGTRRSELVSLNIEDLALSDEGLIIHIRKGKTDQTGRGRKIPVSYGQNKATCPILALNEWLNLSAVKTGAIFHPINQWGHISPTRLTDQSVRIILKEALKRAGVSERGFSGHSLRAGFATVAAINGASERDIQRTTGHVSLEVLRRYIRDGELFKNSASRRLGL